MVVSMPTTPKALSRLLGGSSGRVSQGPLGPALGSQAPERCGRGAAAGWGLPAVLSRVTSQACASG